MASLLPLCMSQVSETLCAWCPVSVCWLFNVTVLTAVPCSSGAVDLDIYGAFQACCIGILAAPITVKLSKTYFNDPGRNTIFLWTILILAGEQSRISLYHNMLSF